MQKIKRIEALSLAKTVALIYGLLGLIFGVILTLISLAGNLFLGGGNIGSNLLFGLGAIILIPLLNGAFGFIIGWLGGLAFNLTAKWTGGLSVEIVEEVKIAPSPEKDAAP